MYNKLNNCFASVYLLRKMF